MKTDKYQEAQKAQYVEKASPSGMDSMEKWRWMQEKCEKYNFASVSFLKNKPSPKQDLLENLAPQGGHWGDIKEF